MKVTRWAKLKLAPKHWSELNLLVKQLVIFGCDSRTHEECKHLGYCKRLGSEKYSIKALNQCKGYEVEITVVSVRQKK